ncbi:hypothetical protein [Yersinia phage MHG19]|nr:hypothetical protein [Yersinia phage MHG19]
MIIDDEFFVASPDCVKQLDDRKIAIVGMEVGSDYIRDLYIRMREFTKDKDIKISFGRGYRKSNLLWDQDDIVFEPEVKPGKAYFTGIKSRSPDVEYNHKFNQLTGAFK